MDCNSVFFLRGSFFSFTGGVFSSSMMLETWGKSLPASPAQGPRQFLPNPGERAQCDSPWRGRGDLAGARGWGQPAPFLAHLHPLGEADTTLGGDRAPGCTRRH